MYCVQEQVWMYLVLPQKHGQEDNMQIASSHFTLVKRKYTGTIFYLKRPLTLLYFVFPM